MKTTSMKNCSQVKDKNLFSFNRRALQLLASGLFLPGSVGIIDPCEVMMILSASLRRLYDLVQ